MACLVSTGECGSNKVHFEDPDGIAPKQDFDHTGGKATDDLLSDFGFEAHHSTSPSSKRAKTEPRLESAIWRYSAQRAQAIAPRDVSGFR